MSNNRKEPLLGKIFPNKSTGKSAEQIVSAAVTTFQKALNEINVAEQALIDKELHHQKLIEEASVQLGEVSTQRKRLSRIQQRIAEFLE